MKTNNSVVVKDQGCGCILIILGLLGIGLFGAPASAILIIGILVLLLS